MKKELLGGAPLEFNELERNKALKVFAWSFASVMVVFFIDLIGAIDVAGIGWVPVVNTILVAIQQLLKDNRPTT